MRRRALWVVVVVALTAVGVLTWTAMPAWPVIGVAIATTALVLNTITKDLSQDRCLGCGESIAHQPVGVHGRVCPKCGTVNERLALSAPTQPAKSADQPKA
jgi:predicted RNA-binding Zn-ribbon protein involved in translation (DUF1610 family)